MTDVELYAAEVDRAARATARRWPGVIDADDAYQEIWLRLFESDYLDRLSEMDERARGFVLGRIGGQAASGYRDDYEVFSGNVSYGTDEVRKLLRAGLYAKRRDELDPSSETLTEFLDLQESAQALRDSTPHYAEVIAREYLFNEPIENRKLVQRAVDALTREMNRVSNRRFAGHTDGPGSRQVITNAMAQHITKEAA